MPSERVQRQIDRLLDEDELLKMIEEALEARVIEETEQAGRYRFTHAQMQETLLAELSTTSRVRLHGQVAEALERRYGARAEERAGRLAMHFGEGADFYGKNVILASRVASQAKGGEILVSSLLRQLVESSTDASIFSAPREAELKGLAGRHVMYAVRWA